jgi:hypothetical protein
VEYRNITAVCTALKFAEISHYNKGSNDGPKWHNERLVTFISTSDCLQAISHNHSFNRKLSKKLSRQMLGDFHINLLLPLSHIRRSQFQQGIVQEIIQQFGPTQTVLFEPPGEISTPERCVLAIKQSIKVLDSFSEKLPNHGNRDSRVNTFPLL